MNIAEFSDGSDTSDDDYVPDTKQDLPSEVESDGDPEDDAPSDSENANSKGKKRKKPTQRGKKKLKTVAEDEGKQSKHRGKHFYDKLEYKFVFSDEKEKKPQENEEKKKKDDDIWADFMKDTGFKPKGSQSQASTPVTKPKPVESAAKPAQKKEEVVKVVEVFDFAGEEVRVEKEVRSDSAEARLLKKPDEATKSGGPPRRGGISASSALSFLTKKQKITTLEKTKLDWDKFKREENIEEELSTHNKGKDGYFVLFLIIKFVFIIYIFQIFRKTRLPTKSGLATIRN